MAHECSAVPSWHSETLGNHARPSLGKSYSHCTASGSPSTNTVTRAGVASMSKKHPIQHGRTIAGASMDENATSGAEPNQMLPRK